MPSLFNMPTPEAVRASARQQVFNQPVAPRGRGFVQAAQQAGGLFGEALGRAGGGLAPGEEQAMKFQAIQSQITDKFRDTDLSDPMNQIEMMGETAQLLGSAGFQDQAMQVMGEANKIRAALPKEKSISNLSNLQQVPGAAKGTLGQQDLETKEWKVKVKPEKGQSINVRTAQNPWEKALAKGFEEIRKEVPSAIKSINTAETMLGMLDKPILTGSTATARTAVGNFMKTAGIWDDDKNLISNTQTYMATSGKQTAQVIRDFGSGTGLSDADREYANMIAGGNINVDPKALRDINRLNVVAAVNKISEYNKQVMQADLPDERKEQLLQTVPAKYQKLADNYRNKFGKNNTGSIKWKGKKVADKKGKEVVKQSEVLAPADKQALDWANANPDDPRSVQIKQRLGKE